jgi:hypothetical protein
VRRVLQPDVTPLGGRYPGGRAPQSRKQRWVIQHALGAHHTIAARLTQAPFDVFLEQDVPVREDRDADGGIDGADVGVGGEVGRGAGMELRREGKSEEGGE